MLPLILTPGDPLGVGAEVAAAALASHPPDRPVIVLGAPAPFHSAARHYGLNVDGARVAFAEPPPGPEPVEIRAIRAAVTECLAGRAAALVTGPIHKGRLAKAGLPWHGHTELLGLLCGVDHPVMAFVGGRVRVALVTVHVPLRRVPELITANLLLHTLRTADAALRDQLHLPRRRLAMCGLNPHAGDDGALGHEEQEVIAPATQAARAGGLDVLGPISAEHAFILAVRGEVDMVIATYHDQGLAPLKALDFGRSVNWTLGLPIIRTSVDHGTADDLAGRFCADSTSMAAAIGLADELARPRSDLALT